MAEGPLNPAFGTMEQLDGLLADAGRRRLRVVVEVHAAPGKQDELPAEARFWLNRGVAGLYVSGDASASGVRAIRPVLRQFVGERVLIGDGDAVQGAGVAKMKAAASPRPMARRGRPLSSNAATTAAASGLSRNGADLLLRSLRGLRPEASAGGAADFAVLRRAFAPTVPGAGHHGVEAGTALWQIAEGERPASPEQARAWITVLLSARGGVALRAADLGGLAHLGGGAGQPVGADATESGAPASAAAGGAPAAAPSGSTGASAADGAASVASGDGLKGAAVAEDPTVIWTARMLALHRGNAALRGGAVATLDHDADGVLVVLWRPADGPPLVEAVNLGASAVRFSLGEDMARARVRGTFLRTVLRSDNGMGAMPLRAVSLPSYGVYLGQVSR